MTKRSRAEYLLEALLKNPGKEIFVKKHVESNTSLGNKERLATIKDVETALQLMSVPYEKYKSYRIKVLKDGKRSS